MENNKAQARRKLLKKAAASGGVVATAAALPTTWTKPLLNSVVSPAHAQMSEEEEMQPITGVFTASGLQGEGQVLGLNELQQQGPQFTLLHALIPAAYANNSAGNAFCGNLDGNGLPSSTFDLVIRINEDETVDLAIDGSFTTDSTAIVCSGTSTISGTAIADASVNIGNSDGDDCLIDLSGMTASESEITGSWTFNFADNNTDSIALPCSGNFTAPLSGSFPTVSSCSDIFLFLTEPE